MKIQERLVWILLLGISLGTIHAFWSQSSHDKIGNPISIEGQNSLLSLVQSYLLQYYKDSSNLNSIDLMYGAASGLYNATGDPYTAVFPPKLFRELFSDISGNIAGIGIYLQKKDDRVSILSIIPSSPAAKSGLRKRDQILSINAIPIGNFSIDEISAQIRGTEGSWVVLDIFRPSSHSYMHIRVRRATISVPSIFTENLPNLLKYVKIMDFNDYTLQEIREFLVEQSNMSGLIIDLRENPGGQLEVQNSIASLFLPKGSTITTLVGKNETSSTHYQSSEEPLFPLDKPIVVLIGEQTASAAEILAAALRDNKRAILVGERTFGKGSVQTIFPLTYGGEVFGVKITVAHYLTPHGVDINRIGITPDVKVSLPKVSPLNQEKIFSILNASLLEDILGKELQTPLSPVVWEKLLRHLRKAELSLPPALLKRIIKEQQNILHGQVYTVEWEFDTQLAKALELLKNP